VTSPETRFICKLPSGLLYLAESQFLRGYCILEAEPIIKSLNDLSEDDRKVFLLDMARVGDALLKVTGAYRMNYAIMGNSQPILHAHIVPRYASEPDEFKQGLPWSYPDDQLTARVFDLNQDHKLIQQIAALLI